MLKCEVTSIRQNRIPRVPGLRESYIYHDPWTYLNVKQAKIMQVNGLCSVDYSSTEHSHYVIPHLPFLAARTCTSWTSGICCTGSVSPDADSVGEIVAYLIACNSLFERGILGKKVFIKSKTSCIISNIDSGYSYFSKGLDEHLDKCNLGFNTCFDYTSFHFVYLSHRLFNHWDSFPPISLLADVGSLAGDGVWFSRFLWWLPS